MTGSSSGNLEFRALIQNKFKSRFIAVTDTSRIPRKAKVGIVFVLTTAYALLLTPLNFFTPVQHMQALTILPIVPVITAAWFFGIRGGLLTSLICQGITIAFLDMIFKMPITPDYLSQVIGGLSLMLIAAVVGYIITIANWLREEIAFRKTITGFISICAKCKKIRNDKGYWEQVEKFIADNSDASFTHGYCPNCMADTLKDLPAAKKKSTNKTRP